MATKTELRDAKARTQRLLGLTFDWVVAGTFGDDAKQYLRIVDALPRTFSVTQVVAANALLNEIADYLSMLDGVLDGDWDGVQDETGEIVAIQRITDDPTLATAARERRSLAKVDPTRKLAASPRALALLRAEVARRAEAK